MTAKRWKDPPREEESRWRAAVRELLDGDSEPTVRCPVCGEAYLRLFILRFDTQVDGGYWVWCAACGSFEHGSLRVPAWWRDVALPPGIRLRTDPDWLNKHYLQVRHLK